MAGNDDKATFAIIVAGYAIARRRRSKRSVWVKKWLQRRKEYGVGNTLLRELRDEYALNDDYKKYLRIDPEIFDELLDLIRHKIECEDTNFRSSISPTDKLALTLRYLATGMCL
jgi:hypothetical protein